MVTWTSVGVPLRLAEAGVGVSREEFSDGQTQESIEGILLGSSDLFRLDDREVDISTELKVYPSFTVSGRVRTDSRIAVSYEFIKDFTYKLSFTHAYDSEPQSMGATKSDWSLVTSLVYPVRPCGCRHSTRGRSPRRRR